MGENVTSDYTPENQLQTLLRTWIYLTEVLVTDGYSACLLKEFSNIVSGQIDQARVSAIAVPPVSSITETALSEGLRTPAILSLITDHQKCDDASSLSVVYNGPRNYAAGSDARHRANVYSKLMSRSNVEDRADAVTDDGFENETNYSDFDDSSGVPPCLVSDSACLSQYHSRGPAQPCENTLTTEETTSQNSFRVSSRALTQLSSLRGPLPRRESQSLPMTRPSISHNTALPDPPVLQTIPFPTAGLGNSSLGTDQSDDVPRKASPLIDPFRIQTERHTRLADPLALLTGSTISPDMLSRIPDPEISNLWHYLRSQRASLLEGLDKTRGITEPQETAADRIKILLARYQTQYEALSSDNEYFPDLYLRLYLANIYSLKEHEAKTRKESPRKRKRKRQKTTNSHEGVRRSLNDDFVDFLLPQLLQKEGDTRRAAKGRFENWMALGRTCSKLMKEFGAGIFLRLPQDIANESLRDFSKLQEDALIAHLNQTQPTLKSDIENLTAFLVQVVEDQRVPSKRLKLEMLSEHDMESRERADGSLQDLFEFSDEIDYTSFLTNEALSLLYSPRPETPACSVTRWTPAGDDSSVLLGTHVFDSPDQTILYDAEHLEDGKSMERFNGDFFLV